MSSLIDEAGKELAEKGTIEILKILQNIYGALAGHYKVLNQEVIIDCMGMSQEFRLSFEANSGILKSPKIRFPFGRPSRINLTPVRGGSSLNGAISLTDSGFEISSDKMQQHDLFFLEVRYDGLEERYINSIVQRSHAVETVKERENEYWLHAALKHPEVLKNRYGSLELRDLDLNVDVGIAQDVKTAIPNVFRNELEAAVALLDESNPHNVIVSGRNYIQQRKRRGSKSKSLKEVMSGVQGLFFPEYFSKFVKVKGNDFSYRDCHQGKAFYDTLPFATIPKNMTVVCGADLNLDNYVANDTLIYNKNDFLEKFRKVFDK